MPNHEGLTALTKATKTDLPSRPSSWSLPATSVVEEIEWI